jgi:hypothetical protein
MNLVTLCIPSEQPLFCPVTGVQMLGRGPFQASPATLFVYIPEVGEVESEDPWVNSLWTKVSAEGEAQLRVNPFTPFLNAVSKQYPNLVVFRLDDTESGCGPVNTTVFLGINFDHGGSDENAASDEDD